MKYVIEKAGAAVSPVSVWTPALAEKCGLKGNLSAPKELPFSMNDGKTLRAVVLIKTIAEKYKYITTDGGSLDGNNWVIRQKDLNLPLESAKHLASEEIKNIRNGILEGNFNWILGEDTFLIQGQDTDLTKIERTRDLLKEAVTRGVPTDRAVQAWRTADNQWTPPLTTEQINDMAYAKGQQSLACWARYRELEGIIASAEISSVTKLRALDLNSGWPEVGPAVGDVS